MKPVLHHLSQHQAESYGLVLSSEQIAHGLTKGNRGWMLWVPEKDVDAARQAIQAYKEEQHPAEGDPATPSIAYGKTRSGLLAALILGGVHLIVNAAPRPEAILDLYGASAAHILEGQAYRLVTALMLHAGPLHLVGNMAGLALFGTAVASLAGWGLGWLLIAASGIAGNGLNAWVHAADHWSVGASTAVFGAVGILSAHQFALKINRPNRRMRALLPLGGGLALLAFLGAGTHTDLLAHLFGFMAGLVIGIFYAVLLPKRPAAAYQAACLFVLLSIIALSWSRMM